MAATAFMRNPTDFLTHPNQNIEGLLFFHAWQWRSSGPGPVEITYRMEGSGWGEHYHNYQAYTRALGAISDVAGLTFRYARADETVNFVERIGTLEQVHEAAESTFPWAFHAAPSSAGVGGTTIGGMFNFEQSVESVSAGGRYGQTYIHEILHGLGLSHPHRSGSDPAESIDHVALPGVWASTDLGDGRQNHMFSTVMSYNSNYRFDAEGRIERLAGGAWADESFGYAMGPMALDIAALQFLYGVNWGHATGDDTYVLPTANDVGTGWRSIWDAGGNDWIVHNGTDRAFINLSAATLREGDVNAGGALNHVANIRGGFTIANGVEIENARGGSGNDEIIGNDIANELHGNGGLDTIHARAGNDRVFGGDGRDHLHGEAGQDDIWGGDDADVITGGDQSDDLYGEDGDDTVWGGNDRDFLWGGEGNDRLWGGEGHDELVGDAGNDHLDGGTGVDTMRGGIGDDTYVVDDRADVIIERGLHLDLEHGLTFGGNDSVISELASYTLGANLENLTLSYATIDRVSGTVTTTERGHGIGNALDNVIVGDIGRDRLEGLGGNDRLDGGRGADVMYGGAGNDTYVVDDRGDLVNELNPATLGIAFDHGTIDTIETTLATFDLSNAAGPIFTDVAPIRGTIENLAYTGTGVFRGFGNAVDNEIHGGNATQGFIEVAGWPFPVEGDYLFGAAGNDSIYGRAGNDTLEGGQGADVLNGGAGNDVLITDNGTIGQPDGLGDLVRGEGDFDTVTADASVGAAGLRLQVLSDGWDYEIDRASSSVAVGIDLVVGSAAGDVIDARHLNDADGPLAFRGDGGNDTLIATTGRGIFNGGEGDDTLVILGNRLDYSVVPTEQSGGLMLRHNPTGSAIEVGSVERVRFENGGTVDTMTLTYPTAAPVGQRFHFGTEGGDVLAGGAGDDRFFAGAGADAIDGGEGIDWIDFSMATSDVAVSLTSSLGWAGEALGDTYVDIENFQGGIGNDALYGAFGDSVLIGGGGSDTLVDYWGRNMMHGGEGDDVLAITNSEDSFLFGDEGNDWLESYGGNHLYGGAGDDVLESRGGGPIDFMIGGGGADTFQFRFLDLDAGTTSMIVEDFEDGTDHLRIVDAEGSVLGFDSVSITDVAGNAVISWGAGNSMTLSGIGAAQLDRFDFLAV